MAISKLRTAARLTSKPLTAFEREGAGYDAGKRDALAARSPRHTGFYPGEDYAEGYCRGYSRVAGDGGLGR